MWAGACDLAASRSRFAASLSRQVKPYNCAIMGSEEGRASRSLAGARPARFATTLSLLALAATSAEATVLLDVEAEVAQALEDLRSGDVQQRYRATVTLGSFPQAAVRAMPDLAAALSDPHWSVRLGAARASEILLPRQTDEELTRALILLLEDPSERVRVAATFALAVAGSVPPSIHTTLQAGTESGYVELQVASWVALIRHFPKFTPEAQGAAPAAAALLDASLDREAASEPDEEWGDSPGSAAARFARATALLDPLLAQAQVPNLVERFEAGSAAAGYAAEAMAPYLARFAPAWVSQLESESPDRQREATMAIGLLGISSEAAIRSMSSLLDRQGAVARDVARSLGRLGPRAAPAISNLERVLLSTNDRELREAAGLALIQIDFDRIESLARRIRQADPVFSEWLTAMAAISRL